MIAFLDPILRSNSRAHSQIAFQGLILRLHSQDSFSDCIPGLLPRLILRLHSRARSQIAFPGLLLRLHCWAHSQIALPGSFSDCIPGLILRLHSQDSFSDCIAGLILRLHSRAHSQIAFLGLLLRLHSWASFPGPIVRLHCSVGGLGTRLILRYFFVPKLAHLEAVFYQL